MNLGAEVVRLFATLALKLDHFSDAFQAVFDVFQAISDAFQAI